MKGISYISYDYKEYKEIISYEKSNSSREAKDISNFDPKS